MLEELRKDFEKLQIEYAKKLQEVHALEGALMYIQSKIESLEAVSSASALLTKPEESDNNE